MIYWPLSYLARAVVERFFAAANRRYGLDMHDQLGWNVILLQVTLTFVSRRPACSSITSP